MTGPRRRIRRIALAVAGGLFLTLALWLTFHIRSLQATPAPAPAPEVPSFTYAPIPTEAEVQPPAPPLRQAFTEPGRVQTVTVDSKVLGVKKRMNVYLPPGYDASKRSYPVIYLLRGSEGEWIDAKSSTSRQGRSAVTIANDLIMSGAIPPVILAMPSFASDDTKVISLGFNLPSLERAGVHPGLGTGRFEDYFVDEVIPTLDSSFRTIPNRNGRGLDGFSLGGYQALYLALKHPNLFSSVGVYEASLLWPGARLPNGSVDPYVKEDMSLVLGDNPDPKFIATVNPLDLVQAMDTNQLKRLSFHLQSAPPNVGDSNRNQAFVQALAAKGITNSFSPYYITGAKHGWYWADEHLKQALSHHLQVLAQAK